MGTADMYHVSRLPNGVTVATVEMPHMASVSVGLWVGVGGRYEPAPLNGVSHFIEHMLFKGTRRRSPRDISQDVEGLGGSLNAFTGEESTCFYAKAHHDHLDILLDVLTDMFLHSRFDPGDIEKERGVIKEELAMYLDQPHQQVQELLNELMWPGHPLGRSLTGSVKTIDALTRAQMVDFRRRNFVAPCTLVATAGAVKHTQVLKAVGRHAPHFMPGRRPAFLPADSEQTQPRLRLFTKRTSQTQMALGIRTCSRHDDRRFALRLLNILLGENMSSRLFQILREDRGLVYDVHSSLSAYEDTGVLVISAGLDTDKLPAVLKLIRRELKRLTDQPPTPAEFRQARDYLLGQLDLGLEGTENQMNWVGDHLLGYGKIIQPSEVKRQLSQVTPAQVRSVARAFICPPRINLALVSPLKRDTGLYDRLQV